MEIKIYSAKGQKKLSFLAGTNRPIVAGHVQKMVNSVKKNGILRPIIVAKIKFITGAPVDYILDGQHLHTAISKLDMDYPVVFCKREIPDYETLVDVIAELNNTSKSWSLHDYVQVWTSTGNRHYKKLQEYYAEYKLPYSTLCMVLNKVRGGGAVQAMKTGKFRIFDEEESSIILKNIANIFDIVDSAYKSEQRVFVTSYIEVFKELGKRYKHKQMLDGLKTHKTHFTTSLSSTAECKDMLMRIYEQWDSRSLTVLKAGTIKGSKNQ